jgi:hypothetical protein
MAENSGFFASVGGDRKYNMDFLARWIASIIGNGVYDGELAVTAGDGMAVTLSAGRAWINGYHYRNDGPLTLPIANADGVLHRKDTVVLRWDVNARSITAQVLTGTFSSSPIAPQITRSAEQYDLKIAEISIPAGTTTITQSLITDTRLDNAVCGIVTGVVQQVDTTTLYQQIQDDLTRFRTTNEADFTGWSAEQKAAFDAWLQTMKDIPPEDAAVYLQNQIDAIQTDKLGVAEKGQPSGICPLGTDGLVPKEYINLNFSGTLVVHASSSDGGSVAGTRVRIRNEQLRSNYVQPLDALGNTVFSLLENHTYYVVLLDYPSAYYGAAATVTITGGETQEITLTLKTEPDVVGWRINKATGAVEYTNGAKNFEPMSVAGGTLNAGSWEQHWATDVKPCLLKNMVVQYYLKKTGVFLYDYEHQANGTSSDIRSGDDGDVMNEIPLMYYKFWDSTDPDGTEWNNFALAKEPQDDTWCCNAFLNRSGVPQDTIYIPAYKGSIYQNKLRSLCGVVPTASQTIGAFRTAANANGTGYEIRDLMKDRFLAALFILFFKSIDGQAALGIGAISGGPVASGTLNDKPLFWGVPSASSGLKFMGMEFFWGNMFEWLDGIGWISSGNFGYKIRPPYNDDRSGYSDSGIAIPESGYIDTMATANGFGMVPKTTVSDEASSKFHDYYYQNSENEPIIYCGSHWGAGARCGPFSWYGRAVAGADTTVGASLFATPQ